MQIKLLNVLRCPLSGQSFQLTVEEEISVERNGWSGPSRLRGDQGDETREILTGWLITEDKKYRYPIVRGVPRMLVDTNLKDPTSVNQQFTRPDGSLSPEYQQTIEHFRTQCGRETQSRT